jgi:hypothetical protein
VNNQPDPEAQDNLLRPHQRTYKEMNTPMKAKRTKKTKPTTKRKEASPRTKPHIYVLPKTAAELGITCGDKSTGVKCGQPALWFDWELGEKDFYSGIVCDDHRVSNRVEKLAV